MFASSIINHITVNAGRELALSVQAFFMSADIVSIFIKIWHLGPPVYALNGRTAFTVECDRQRVRPGCFFYYTLCYKKQYLHSALSSASETSAHETSLPFGHLNTNALRQYNDRGQRRRRPADSLPLRQELIDRLQQQYTIIRTVKVKDSGTLFIARIKTSTGRTVHRTAYSLPQLALRLCEGLNGVLF